MSVDMVVSTEQTNLILTDKKASCRECHHTQSKVLLFLERECNMAYICCEKELENYICNHQDEFILVLKNTVYGEDCDIKFLGSQVKIGESNIADLIYYYDEIEKEVHCRLGYYELQLLYEIIIISLPKGENNLFVTMVSDPSTKKWVYKNDREENKN